MVTSGRGRRAAPVARRSPARKGGGPGPWSRGAQNPAPFARLAEVSLEAKLHSPYGEFNSTCQADDSDQPEALGTPHPPESLKSSLAAPAALQGWH